MRERPRRFSPEFNDEAVKMVIESSRPIAEVAREIQVNEGTLGNWVNRYRTEHAYDEPPLTMTELGRFSPVGRTGHYPSSSEPRPTEFSPATCSTLHHHTLHRLHAFFVIEHATRRVHILGATAHPRGNRAPRPARG